MRRYENVVRLDAILIDNSIAEFGQAEVDRICQDASQIPLEIDLFVNSIESEILIPFLTFLYSSIVKCNPTRDVLIVPKISETISITSDKVRMQFSPMHMCSVDCTAVGGTFDHIHAGHKLLLTVASLFAKKRLVVGVTQAPSRKVNSEFMDPFADRAASALSIVYRVKPSIVVSIEALNDVAGPTGRDPLIDTLVLSEETISGGSTVNEIRQKNGLKPLNIFVIPIIQKTDGSKLSSTFLRGIDAEKMASQ